MRGSEKKLYNEELNVCPNRYAVISRAVLSFFIIVLLLLNEFGIFRVRKNWMRISAFSSLIILLVPLFAASTSKGLSDTRTKYLVITCTSLAVAILCTALSFHAVLALVFPILLAAQYPSRKMSRIAIIFSSACAFLSPVLGYLTGSWQVEFIEWLCKVIGRTSAAASGADVPGEFTNIANIILYLSVPNSLIVLAFYPLSGAIARGGEKRLSNQIRVLHMSESDALTGLLNRVSYERDVKREVWPKDGNVSIVYMDANDLHRVNNEKGHAEGDRLLVCVADSLLEAFDNESVYRTGGDEFVVIMYGLTLEELYARAAQVKSRVEARGYSVALGVEYGQPPCTLPALLASAETKMMADKRRYYRTHDRRKHA